MNNRLKVYDFNRFLIKIVIDYNLIFLVFFLHGLTVIKILNLSELLWPEMELTNKMQSKTPIIVKMLTLHI